MTDRPRRLLVFQHLDVEHPGVFRDFLARDGIAWDVVELDAGDAIPPLEDYGALWVMGGPMDVWEEDRHPWLRQEQAAIRRAVNELQLPYLGFCLGHQLLAAALGGEVGPADQPEVGVLDVRRTEHASPFLAGVDARFDVLQWHAAEVKETPPSARVLATSPRCAVQAMSVGTHAFSMQFHVEITADTVPDWQAIPAYRAALERSLGAGGDEGLRADAAARLETFNALAARLYANWCRTTGFGGST